MKRKSLFSFAHEIARNAAVVKSGQVTTLFYCIAHDKIFHFDQ